MVQPNASVEIYQLPILLLQINPPIWRRLHVRNDSSIATLHDLLLIAFDWSDFRLEEAETSVLLVASHQKTES